MTRAAEPQGNEHQRRARRLLLATGALMLTLGMAWAIFFRMQGVHALVPMELALALLGIAVFAVTLGGHLRAASWTTFLGLFVYLCLFAAIFDVQTAEIPRSTHLFLLVLTAAAHHVFRTERDLLRYSALTLFLAAFVVFAAMPETVPRQAAIPDSVRRGAIWINLLTVAASLIVVLRLAENTIGLNRSLHRALRDALSRRQFVLHYQPQVDARGTIVGAEALIRWNDPQRGMIPPGEFIQAAEETGFILPLGHWAFETVCRQLAAWHTLPRLGEITLSVNVSALQMQQPDFVQVVLDVLQRSGADPHKLTLELTESSLVHDIDDIAQKLDTLAAAGLRLSLDDFGTGYSSLSHLHRLPLAEVKIDRAFTMGIPGDSHAASIARNLLRLGNDLHIDVIAEGIETADQHAYLREHGCRYFQGYLIGKPMPAEQFEHMVSPTDGATVANPPA